MSPGFAPRFRRAFLLAGASLALGGLLLLVSRLLQTLSGLQIQALTQ